MYVCMYVCVFIYIYDNIVYSRRSLWDHLASIQASHSGLFSHSPSFLKRSHSLLRSWPCWTCTPGCMWNMWNGFKQKHWTFGMWASERCPIWSRDVPELWKWLQELGAEHSSHGERTLQVLGPLVLIDQKCFPWLSFYYIFSRVMGFMRSMLGSQKPEFGFMLWNMFWNSKCSAQACFSETRTCPRPHRKFVAYL